ncbi:hypothetical protein N7448_011137 [Penicillium atrosanguineum]|nr:hypothetical protein N7448_011137 [Penicillium atrosanguineum]
MTLTSNQRRAQVRQECREALAAHIRERLGLVVPPQRVRLQPSPEDGYAWAVLEGKKYLLATNLGNGTVGRYQEIQQSLGLSLEAVTPQSQQPKGPGTTSNMDPEIEEPGFASFTETICELEHDKKGLTVELERARARSEELLSKDREWQAKSLCLQEELKECKSSVNRLEKELGWAKDGMIAAMKALQNSQLIEEDFGTPPCRLQSSLIPVCSEPIRLPRMQ